MLHQPAPRACALPPARLAAPERPAIRTLASPPSTPPAAQNVLQLDAHGASTPTRLNTPTRRLRLPSSSSYRPIITSRLLMNTSTSGPPRYTSCGIANRRPLIRQHQGVGQTSPSPVCPIQSSHAPPAASAAS